MVIDKEQVRTSDKLFSICALGGNIAEEELQVLPSVTASGAEYLSQLFPNGELTTEFCLFFFIYFIFPDHACKNKHFQMF